MERKIRTHKADTPKLEKRAQSRLPKIGSTKVEKPPKPTKKNQGET